MEEREYTGYNMDDSNDFGLAEADFQTIDREEELPPHFQEPRYYEEEEESDNRGLMIAAVIGFVVLIGLVVYLFAFNGTEHISSWFGDDEPVQNEVTVVTPEPEPVYEESQPETVYEEPIVEEEFPSPDSYAGIERIAAPTGRTYVIVGSFVDYDLAMDYARQLETQGIGSKILDPTQRAPLVHRVAVADFETFREGMNNVDTYRTNYGENAWILKY